jgi:proteasome activator subunit 4
MSEIEKSIYNFFNDQSNVDKLMEYWALEEKKGKDKFNRTRFNMIKSLCDGYGDLFLDNLMSNLKRLIEEKSLENNHRAAAEVMGGIMKGAKHWSYEKTHNMYEKMIPLIHLALLNVTVETDMFWGTCFATAAENIDPMKQWWLHEVLLEEPLRDTTSFIDCSRLYCLQGAFNQHVWRMNSVAYRLLGKTL